MDSPVERARVALWTSAQIVAATGGRVTHEFTASGVSIDSRTLDPGDLFVALRERRDGHEFVAGALANGAAAALVARQPGGVPAHAPLVLVDDTMAALDALGRASRARTSAHVIAVTGSVGKTGTKEALRLAFGCQARTHASEASYNNHWGVPLSLARMPADTEFGIFELGMNHPGELGPLSRLVRPHLAIVTTIEPAHLAYFKNVAAIADAKAEIFQGLEPGGVVVLNRDNRFFGRLAAAAADCGAVRILGFGEHPESFARLVSVSTHPTMSTVSAEIGGHAIAYTLGVPGRHWVQNSLAVLAAVKALDGDLGRAGMALGQLAPLRGRGQRHRVAVGPGTIEVIDESYNASPASMRAAIATLATAEAGARGRRIAVLGDMLELGPDSPRLHAGLADDIVAAGLDLVFTAGPNMAYLHEALPAPLRGVHCDKAADLAGPLLAALRAGDVVMVKGSLGSRMGPVVEALIDDDGRRVGGAADDGAATPQRMVR